MRNWLASVGTDPLDAAHKHCIRNRQEILKSKMCGCFYCGSSFASTEIWEWIDEGETAMCPKCGIDSVLGDASGFMLSKNFLDGMNARWFS